MEKFIKTSLVSLIILLSNVYVFAQGQIYSEELYAKYANVTDEQIKKWQEEADNLFTHGHYMEAYQVYNDALTADQVINGNIRTDLMYKSALCLENTGKYNEAILAYNALNMLKPSNDVSAAIERIKTIQSHSQNNSTKDTLATIPSDTINFTENILTAEQYNIANQTMKKLNAKYSKNQTERIQKWEEKADNYLAKGKYAKAVKFYGKVFQAELANGKMRSDLYEKQQTAHNLFMEQNKQRQYTQNARATNMADILMPIGNMLLNVAETIPDNTNNTVTDNTGENHFNNHNNENENQTTDHSASEVQAMQTDRRTYSSWESQLIKMNTYYESEYDDNQRRHIQQQMKSIRPLARHKIKFWNPLFAAL